MNTTHTFNIEALYDIAGESRIQADTYAAAGLNTEAGFMVQRAHKYANAARSLRVARETLAVS